MSKDSGKFAIFGAKKPSLAVHGFDKLHVSKDLDGLYVSKDHGLIRAKKGPRILRQTT